MQINLKLDCTLYTGLGVHFYRNIHLYGMMGSMSGKRYLIYQS